MMWHFTKKLPTISLKLSKNTFFVFIFLQVLIKYYVDLMTLLNEKHNIIIKFSLKLINENYNIIILGKIIIFNYT